MGTKLEINFLRLLLGFSIISFFHLVRKPPTKDWVIIFLLKSYISSFLDSIITMKGYIEYPVRLFKSFNISVIFSYLLYPVICIYFNKVTKNSNLFGVVVKAVYFTTPIVFVETLLEKYTNLIKYKKTWNWKYSYSSVIGTFLLVRFLMYIINKKAMTQRKRKIFFGR